VTTPALAGRAASVDTMAAVVVCPSCATKNRVPTSAKGHPQCPKCQTDLPWLVDAGDAEFTAAVDTRQLVLVDLWAPWCGPCKMIAPILENLSREFAGRLKVVKVNVDDSPTVAQRYDARSIPMLLVMQAGEVVETIVGAQPERVFRDLLTKHLAG
jgi:thioredoxin 2